MKTKQLLRNTKGIFVLLCSVALLSVTSCKHSNDPTPTPPAKTQAELLVQSKWNLTGVEFFYNNTWNSQPLDDYFKSFVRFTSVTYSSTGTISILGPGYNDTGTYTINTTSITTKPTDMDSNTVTIVSLTDTKLQTSYNFTGNGITFRDGTSPSFIATGIRETFTH